jgi:hypothetical protein
MSKLSIEQNYAIDTALPQDWLDDANKRLPMEYDPRGEIGWGYPPGFTFGGIPVPLTEKGVLILGLLAR